MMFSSLLVRLAGATTMAMAVSACARGQQPCNFSARNIGGAYAVTATVRGAAREGTVIIRVFGDTATGTLNITGLPPLRLRRVKADSNHLTAEVMGAGDSASLAFTFTGDSYSGELRQVNQSISLRGRMLPPCGAKTGASESMDVAALSRTLGDSVSTWLARFREPGLAVAIVDGCVPWWTGTFGVTDFDSKRPVARNTVYQMGSISKTFAAWATMRLVDQGRIDLDAPVTRYLTTWAFPPSKFDAGAITVRQLLSHTGGTNVEGVLGITLPVAFPTLRKLVNGEVAKFADQKVQVVAAPGREFRYSGGGYEVLQLMIEEVTGEPLSEYISREILTRLDMRSSTFAWSDSLAAHVATPYQKDGITKYPQLIFPGVAAAGLYASIDDMTKFLLAHCAQNGSVAGAGIVSPETLVRMMRPDPVAIRYGLGYEVVPINGVARPGHAGSNPGWKTNFMLLPERGLGIVVLTNAAQGQARNKVLSAFRDAIGLVR